jgi:A/G-specific adenine glycosylase
MSAELREAGTPAGFFAELLQWYSADKRDLPWRRTGDPYAILVSEIMLQQTRVEAVIPFYLRFMQRFPDARSLAEASLEDVYEHWAGLGYYRRARNLQAAAAALVARGAFPQTETELRRLPGVGEYTAAALASIAFGNPALALDGNALRVLARVHGVDTDVTTAATRQALRRLTLPHIPYDHAGDFTQALMELGARMCTPRQPRCLICPLRQRCAALASGSVVSIPRVPPRRKPVLIHLAALRVRHGPKTLLECREKDEFLEQQWVVPWFSQEAAPAQIERYQAEFPGSEPRYVGEARHGVTFRDLRIAVWEWETAVELCGPGRSWFTAGEKRLPRFTSKILDVAE